MRTLLLCWIVIAVACVGCSSASKDVTPALSASDSGDISFASAGSLVWSSDGTRFVRGDPVVLSGDLDFPAGAGPFPAVILAHGCSGITAGVTAWTVPLQEWGYATFVIESFRGRGLNEVCTNQLALTPTQRIPDAYGALRTLTTHPKVDARRVALMGFSHGGTLTIGASTVWAKETFVSPGQPAFRAFLSVYPYCNTAYPERERISAPLRIHTGELDDWTPATPCIRLTESLTTSRQDAMITVYPGAHHAFDNLTISQRYLPNVESPADCSFQLASILGPLPTRSEMAKCLRKGATIGRSPSAAEEARRNVRRQLTELLGGR